MSHHKLEKLESDIDESSICRVRTKCNITPSSESFFAATGTANTTVIVVFTKWSDMAWCVIARVVLLDVALHMASTVRSEAHFSNVSKFPTIGAPNCHIHLWTCHSTWVSSWRPASTGTRLTCLCRTVVGKSDLGPTDGRWIVLCANYPPLRRFWRAKGLDGAS
jgi:hypothetical protein